MTGQRVVIVGQGYVGLPLAVAAAAAGHDVTGVDQNSVLVHALNQGTSFIEDVPEESLRSVIALGRYRAAEDVSAAAEADTVVLCVPTPYHNDEPDLSHVQAAAQALGKHLSPDTLVILESTTYPGTTEEILLPILEQASGLSASGGFHLAFSPERIDPGNPVFNLRNTPKVVGGVTPDATERAARFYGSFVERVERVSGPRVAEMAKLLENTFRHINIALVNELAILSQDLGVDVWEVIAAASSKPFGFMPFYPGPGVGGHCIPVDPMYLSWRVRQFGGAAKFIELARDVNAAMPLYCVNRVQELLNERERSLKGARVLVVGVAYKPNVGDLRESPALVILEDLLRRGAVAHYHDPYVGKVRVGDSVLRSVDLDGEMIAAYDCVLVATHHAQIDFTAIAERARLVFDTRNVVPARASVVYRL